MSSGNAPQNNGNSVGHVTSTFIGSQGHEDRMTNGSGHRHSAVVKHKLNALENKLVRILDKLDSEVEEDNQGENMENATFDTENRCSICLDQPAIVQTLPCQHAVVCQACFLRSIQSVVNQSSTPESSNDDPNNDSSNQTSNNLNPRHRRRHRTPHGGYNVLCAICRTPVTRARLLTLSTSVSSTSGVSSASGRSGETSASFISENSASSASSARSAASRGIAGSTGATASSGAPSKQRSNGKKSGGGGGITRARFGLIS